MRRRTLLAGLGAAATGVAGARGAVGSSPPGVAGDDPEPDGGTGPGPVAGADVDGSATPAGAVGHTDPAPTTASASADPPDHPAARDRTDGTPWARSTQPLLPGTRYETPVVTIDGPDDGPTVVVIGGLHGDERVGYRAAERVAAAGVTAGRLVVVPRANRPAIEADRREGVGGDLNRQFPPGREPTTRLARALWRVVDDADPDAVVDLHRSTGIYGVHRGSVGQAVFPTVTGEAVTYATAAVEHTNRTEVPWYMLAHGYTRANRIDGTAPLLVHKVAADLGVAGYIVETTNYLVALDTQIDWERAIAEHLLDSHGIGRPAASGEGAGAGTESGTESGGDIGSAPARSSAGGGR